MISRIKKLVQKIIVKIILTFSNKLVGRILKINDNLYLIMVSINDIVYIKNEIFSIVFQNVIDMVNSNQSNKEIIYKMKDSDLFDDITIFMSQLIH